MSTSPKQRFVVLAVTAMLTASLQSGPALVGALAAQPADGGSGPPTSPGWAAVADDPFPDDPPSLSVPPLVSDTPIPSADPIVSDTPEPTEPPITTDPPITEPPVTTEPPITTQPPISNPPISTPPVPTGPGSEPVPVPTGAPPNRPTRNPGPPRSNTPHPKVPIAKKPTAKKPATVRPHPHKTLRPAVLAPGVRRPHPHRKPWPITLTIKTVPALSGVRFTLDGHPLTTGSNGMTSYTAEHDFAGHRLSMVSGSVGTGSQRFQFSRWAGQRDPNQAFSRTVSGLPLRSNYLVTAAFTVQRQVSAQVVRQDGTALDPSLVSLITARSDTGAKVELPLGTPIWLDSERPSFHHSILSAEPVSYSLQSVVVRGSNVVDAGRQTFRPSSTATPTFTTQFHDLTITGHDALFKSALGSSATVTFPDGGTLTRPLNAEHRVTLTNLPRGQYKVTIEAGRSIVGSQQFSLSKDKTADLAVITAWDLAILLGALVLLAVALLVIGRQYWRRLINRPRHAPEEFMPPREKILT